MFAIVFLFLCLCLCLCYSPIFSLSPCDLLKSGQRRNYYLLAAKRRGDTPTISKITEPNVVRFNPSQTSYPLNEFNSQMMETFNSSLQSCDSNKIAFSVVGKPMALGRHRSTKSGIIYNPCKKLQDEFLSACSAYLPPAPLQGPLHATILFYFQRPKNHYSIRKNLTTLKPGMELFYNHRAG
jgi:hypothetical protein